jgi:YD repeat-containing protein
MLDDVESQSMCQRLALREAPGAVSALVRVEEGSTTVALHETARYTYDVAGHMTQAKMGASAVPQVADSGFESGIGGWLPWGSPSYTVGAPAVSGANSLQLTGPVGHGMYQVLGGVTPGQTYVVTAWMQVAGSATGALLVNDANSQNFATAFVPNTFGQWRQVTVTYTATSTAHLAILLQFGAGSGTVYFDEVRVALQSPAYAQSRSFGYSPYNANGPWGLLQSSTTPEKGTVSYAYWANGQLYSKTDAKNQTLTHL